MSQHVLILGAGEIGSAIATVLKEKDVSIDMWDKNPERVADQQPLEAIVPKANVLFLCIPSFAIRPAIVDIAPLLSPGTVIVSLAKSIETDSHQTMNEVLANILPPEQPFAILGGPLLGEELEAGAGGVAVAASASEHAREALTELFKNTSIALETTADAHGAALCGVMKNIYAMGLGAAHGLGWGDNMKGWLASKAMGEMLDIIEQLGGDHKTTLGPAGFGDFIATGFSEHSGHRTFGVQLAQGVDCERNKEGCRALPIVVEMLGKERDTFPLLMALHRIITHNEPLKETLESAIYG